MENYYPNLTSNNNNNNAMGFCLLPSELIQNILLHLTLPEIMSMKLVCKSMASVVSDQGFVRECNLRSKSTTWLFVYKKRWLRDAILQGFADQSTRWFKIAISDLLKPLVFPGEDLYFLTACGNFFLFVCNTRQEVIAVNLVSKTVKTIPDSPLGPRGTSSWRRSGMKLLATGRSDHFRFLFAESVENRPVLFQYSSEADTWTSSEARESVGNLPRFGQGGDDYVFLNVMNGPYESVVMAIGLESNEAPLILRLRFNISREGRADPLRVYGDGHMVIVRSNGGDKVKVVNSIETWGMSPSGGGGSDWEYVSKVPGDIMKKIRKPYGVMMGCIEKSEGVIKIALVSNYECSWEIIWLSYEIGRDCWSWLPLPDCKMKGLNMAGIGFSRGLTLS